MRRQMRGFPSKLATSVVEVALLRKKSEHLNATKLPQTAFQGQKRIGSGKVVSASF